MAEKTEAAIAGARAGYGEFNSRDHEALLARMAPDFEWHEAPEIPGRKSCHNRDEFARYMRGFERLWDEFAFEPQDLTAAEDDDGEVVYARVLLRGRGKAAVRRPSG